MAPLELIEASDSRLTAPNAALPHGSGRTRATFKELHELMERSGGVGIAAPQAGINLKLVVAHLDDNIAERPYDCYQMMNPRIIDHSDMTVDAAEGCLSLPNERWLVQRWAAVTVRYEDEGGKVKEVHAQGWDARVLQHEVDHINRMTIRQSGRRKVEEGELIGRSEI